MLLLDKAPGLAYSCVMSDNYCVIGSGPAGVACARASLERGKRVRMRDAGICLVPARAELVDQLRQSSPAGWEPAQLDRLKEGTTASTKGIPLKLVYGSDFPYREGQEHLPAEYSGVGLRPS